MKIDGLLKHAADDHAAVGEGHHPSDAFVTRTTGTGQPTAFVVLGGVVDGWDLFNRGLGVPLNRGKWKHEEHAGGQEGEKSLETHRFTIGLSHKNPSCSRFVGSLH